MSRLRGSKITGVLGVARNRSTTRAGARGPSASGVDVGPEGRQARRRRDAAAATYRPEPVELLLVAEAPPSALDRYFYFADVPDQDSLFRHVVRAVLGVEPSRTGKADQLSCLADRGVFLIDLKLEPKLEGRRSRTTLPIWWHARWSFARAT